MSNLHNVGISDMKLGKAPDKIVTYALGSCVGICLYDAVLKIGALGHIMLPQMPIQQAPSDKTNNTNKFKFADTCVPQMVKDLEIQGCNRNRLTAKIVGGARMFEVYGDDSFAKLGERNVIAVKKALEAQKIRIIAEDILLNYGRTVFFHLDSGIVEVKSYAKPTKML